MKRAASILTTFELFTLASLILVSATPAATKDDPRCVPRSGKQCVAMETRFGRVEGPRPVKFSLTTTGPGPLSSDSGTVVFRYSTKTLVRDGQGVTVYSGTATWTGKRGAFVSRERSEQFDVGSGAAASVGVWSLLRAYGTGQYTGLRGSGRLAGVAMVSPTLVLIRWEGLVSKS